VAEFFLLSMPVCPFLILRFGAFFSFWFFFFFTWFWSTFPVLKVFRPPSRAFAWRSVSVLPLFLFLVVSLSFSSFLRVACGVDLTLNYFRLGIHFFFGECVSRTYDPFEGFFSRDCCRLLSLFHFLVFFVKPLVGDRPLRPFSSGNHFLGVFLLALFFFLRSAIIRNWGPCTKHDFRRFF